MPIYEYRCDNCQHYLDVLQKISDEHLKDCPECGESALRRLISAPSFRLKGSGWYETDFKSDKDRRRNLAESRDRSEPSGDAGKDKSEGKSDSKSDGKSDSKSDNASAKDAGGKKDSPKPDSQPKASPTGKDKGAVA